MRSAEICAHVRSPAGRPRPGDPRPSRPPCGLVPCLVENRRRFETRFPCGSELPRMSTTCDLPPPYEPKGQLSEGLTWSGRKNPNKTSAKPTQLLEHLLELALTDRQPESIVEQALKSSRLVVPRSRMSSFAIETVRCASSAAPAATNPRSRHFVQRPPARHDRSAGARVGYVGARARGRRPSVHQPQQRGLEVLLC